MRRVLILAVVLSALLPAQENIGPMRVWAGSMAYTDVSGQVWAPDAPYVQGSTAISTAPLVTVSNASNQGLYQTQRISYVSGSACSAFSYVFSVPNNRYRVTLKFAELGSSARSFQAAITGVSPTPTIKTVVGSATDKVYYANVTSGSLTISLTGTPSLCPVMSAVEVVPQIAITETDVSSLLQDLSTVVRMGAGYVANGAVYADANGFLETVVGDPGSCVLIDGTTEPCSFVDAETPEGTVDGVNVTFMLNGSPSPPASLVLVRNGISLSQGTDYTLTGSTITFVSGAIPQPGDLLVAYYTQ